MKDVAVVGDVNISDESYPVRFTADSIVGDVAIGVAINELRQLRVASVQISNLAVSNMAIELNLSGYGALIDFFIPLLPIGFFNSLSVSWKKP